MLILAKSSRPSIEDAHPNEYIDEGFNVIACRMRRPTCRIAAEDIGRHKWYRPLNKIDEQRDGRLGGTYGAVTRNHGKSLIKDGPVVKIDEKATTYKASANLFAPFGLPALKLWISYPPPLLSPATLSQASE